ncbi:MAG TPA: PQQ-dependent sugar dehydrogenase, partial [Labilithrix sp.]|nr:PQQ-dependent sugar dehydrogenase [Labilithrix sp.]
PDVAVDASTDADVEAATPPVPGLAARPANPTCHAFTAPPPSGQARLVDRFPGVALTVPTGLFQRPGDNFRWYVTERAGRIVHFPNDPSAKAADVKVALDLRDVTMTTWDCSLAGLAFPADFVTTKHAYVSYCYAGPQTGGKLQVRISRFASSDGGGTFDRASEQVIVALDHPGDSAHPQVGLHTADAIRFGKDGYLYAAIGDGGPQGKVGGQQAQDKNDLRGKLLRLDVSDHAKALTKDFVAGRQRIAADIPPTNPFAGGGGHAAVYAYGFRNPWQWTFDRKTNAIWLGDVGNSTWEEVNRNVQKGGNYGWSVYEGFTCTNQFGAASCLDSSLIPPLLAYAHGDGPQLGNAVTGGIVYRGTAVPSLTGSYVFGDSSDAHVWAVRNVDTLPAGQPAKELLFDGAPVSSFAEDQDGELFATILYPTGTYPAGKILALEEAPAGPGLDAGALDAGGPPALLSQTGCFDPNDAKTPVPALVPYEPSAELWSDGATKRRWLALPDTKQIALGDQGDLDLPVGSVLVKEFSIGTKRVETRFFVRQEADERWAGYTYVWKDDQTDATLLGTAGAQVDVGGQIWNVPSRAQCHQCHTKVAGTTLGLELGQLNHAIVYPSTGITANQVFTLSQIGLLPQGLGPLPGLANIADTTRSVEERARAYLHANCANCHRPDGPTFTPLDLRWWTPLSQMGICNAQPTIDDLEDLIPSEPRLLAPGAPERSVLYWRLFTTDARVRMPPVGRSLSHAAGAAAVSDWIKATTVCP